MKILYFFICGMAGVVGFLMAGIEATNFISQVYCNVSGAILFAAGMLGLLKLIKNEEDR